MKLASVLFLRVRHKVWQGEGSAVKMKKNLNVPAALALGTGIAVITTMVGSLIAAWLLHSQKIDEGGISYVVMVITVASIILGAVSAAGGAGKQILPVCTGTAAVYLLLLVAVNLLFLDGKVKGFLPTMVLVLGCGVSVSLIYVKFSGNKGKRKRRNR